MIEGAITLTKEQIRKLHVQYGHAQPTALSRIMKAAGYLWEPKELEDITENCGCFSQFNKPQAPIASINRPQFPGQVVHMDVFFPEEIDTQKKPYVIFIDGFSRFCVTKKVTQGSGGCSAENLLRICAAFMDFLLWNSEHHLL